jgi:hypothetical protein
MSLAKDMARAFDPTVLARDVGITLDPWQEQVMRATCGVKNARGILACSRQIGKTTCALLTSLWTILYEAPALVLIVSPSQRQSGEAFRSFLQLYQQLDGALRLTSETLLRCELANGSRVVALPGSEKTIRGYGKVRLIVLDEAARIEDSLIQGITPMLGVSEGSLLALSSPFGRAGWFAETFHDEEGQPEWMRVRVPATECSRLSKEFLASELRALGPRAFEDEYMCAFSDNALQMFSSDLIAAAFDDDSVRPLWG